MLGRHAGLLGRHAGLLGLRRIRFLLVLVRGLGRDILGRDVLRRRRLGLLRVRAVLLRVLLRVGGVGVLVVDGWLRGAGEVGRLGVLLHGDWGGGLVGGFGVVVMRGVGGCGSGWLDKTCRGLMC